MAVPINPGINPAVAGPKRTDFERNAVQIGAAQSAARDVKQEKTEAPGVKADQGLTSQRIAEGVVMQQLGDGMAETRTDSGLTVNFSEQHQHIQFPGGDQIFHSFADKALTGQVGGQPVEVEPFQNAEGAVYGYAYNRPDGTRVSINLEDLTYVLQNKHGNVTQSIGPEGGQVIHMRSDFRNPHGQISKLEQNVFVSPTGEVESLGKAQEGVQVSGQEISFRNPAGLKITGELPLAFDRPLSGELAAAAPAPARTPAAPPPQNFNPGNPVLMEGSDHFTPGMPGNPQVAAGVLNPHIYNPPVGDGLTNTPSGITRMRNAQGTVLQLQNGLTMMHTASGARLTMGDGMPGGPVEVTTRPRPNAPPETQYRFADARGNRFTAFSDSLDFMVESPDGRAVQVMQPDGRVYGAVRGENGSVKRFEIAPDGYNNHDAGLDFGWNPVKREYDRVIMQGESQPVVPLPYPVGEFQKFSGQTPGAGSAYPVSGQMPPGFGNAPTPMPPVPPQIPGGGPQFPELAPSLGDERARLQAEKAANPAGFTPDKQARLDLLSQMTQAAPPGAGPRPQPGAPDPYAPSVMPRPGYPQQPVRPGFMDRLKYLFSGNNEHLAPQGPPRPGMGMPPTQHPMAGQLGGYPNGQYGYSPGPMGAFQGFLAQETAMTSMMGMWALTSSMSFNPWGGSMFYTPFSPFSYSFF